MGNDKFTDICKGIVKEYYNREIAKTLDEMISEDDVYIVWLCKTLQNNKALASTTVPDTRYYELTYNGDKKEIYVDAYVKEKNYAVPVDV